MSRHTSALMVGLILLSMVHFSLAQAADSIVIQDFERDLDISPWPEGAKFEYSTKWSADGKRSLFLTRGTMVAISQMATNDWSGYQVWRFHVNVPGDEGVMIGLELADDGPGHLNRHQNSTSAPPGESVVEVDISGDLWRGEVNRAYRLLKTPIDKKNIRRLAFTAQGGDIYIDKVELVKIVPITTPGGFAFDFGRTGGLVQGQWTGVTPSTTWDPQRGYGIEGEAAAFDRDTPYPTPVMGDGLNMTDARFHVQLDGGRYIGWVIFERSGFWEHQQAEYTSATLRVNGQDVHTHESTPSTPYFLFQDLEVLTQEDIVEKMVLPRQLTADIAFEAVKGRNTIELLADGVRVHPPRLAGLVLAPDTPEGRAFIEAHKQLQRDTIAKVHRLLNRQNREGDPASAKTPLVIVPLQSNTAMRPGDWPNLTESQPIPPIQAMAGMAAPRLLGIYAKGDYRVQVKMGTLQGEGGALPDSAVRVLGNRYLPTHGYDQTACWIETHHYRPAEALDVSPTLARAVLILIEAPDDAKAGTYSGNLTLTALDAGTGNSVYSVDVPISVQVHTVKLPPLDFPSALFYSGVQMAKESLGEDLYWKLSEDMLRQMQRASFTFVTGGPSFELTWNGNTPQYSGEDALKWMEMARKYGLDRKIVNYGGLHIGIGRGSFEAHGNMSPEQTAKAIFEAWDRFRKEHNLPEYYINSYDEPGTPAEFGNVEAFLKLMRQAGFKTIGWTSMRDPDSADENHKMLARETIAPAFNIHTPRTLQYVKELGNEPWIYNQGLDRSSSGVSLFQSYRAGAMGRVQWIAAIIQGFQYDALDSREPDLSCFYFHSELGVLLAPRFLGTIEGGIDARLLFELERRVKAGSPNAQQINALLKEIESRPYRRGMGWAELDDLRMKMLDLLQASTQQ